MCVCLRRSPCSRAKSELAKGRGKNVVWTLSKEEFAKGMLNVGVGLSCKGAVLSIRKLAQQPEAAADRCVPCP